MVTTVNCAKKDEPIRVCTVNSGRIEEPCTVLGGVPMPQERRYFGDISWPFVKYRKCPAWDKVNRQVAAANLSFAVSAAAFAAAFASFKRNLMTYYFSRAFSQTRLSISPQATCPRLTCGPSADRARVINNFITCATLCFAGTSPVCVCLCLSICY